MAFLIGGANSAADTGYDIANSCRFNDDDSPYMHFTPGAAGNRKTMTFSFWFKKGQHTASNTAFFGQYNSANENNSLIQIDGNDRLAIWDYSTSAYRMNLRTNRVFRDHAAWYHICVAIDTTQGTEANRVKIYVNGTQETSFAISVYPSENLDLNINEDKAQQIGVQRFASSNNYFWDGYLAEFFFVDGSALAQTAFGEFDEDSPTIWKPKDCKDDLTFGTNGYYLDFEDSGDLGDDESGNTNDFTEVNLAATDQATDSPTNNFCTMNPLDNFYFGAAFSEGNLKVVSTSSIETFGTGTMGVASGKWYWEVKVTSASGYTNIGIASEVSDSASNYLGEKASTPNYMYDSGTGDSYTGGTGTDHGDTYTTNDIIGVALNLDDNEINYYKNGTVQNSGTAVSITAAASTPIGFYLPAGGDRHDDGATLEFNFGNPTYANSSDAADGKGIGAFEYAPPSGFLALCTKNLGSDGG